MPSEFFLQFKGIIGDEAHLCSANSLKYIITSCSNAEYRIAMTGTLDGTKLHQIIIEALFGLIYKPTTLRELIDKKLISDIKIQMIQMQHFLTSSKMEYQDEIEYLISNEKRNNFICNLAKDMDRNTLILFERVEKHGKILYEKLKELCPNKNVYFIYGGVDSEDREKIRAIFEKDKDATIVASYGTYSTGTSINNLHNLIFAHFSFLLLYYN